MAAKKNPSAGVRKAGKAGGKSRPSLKKGMHKKGARK